ncbi:MAG: c-type cytochrome [Sulfurimonas sp.]
MKIVLSTVLALFLLGCSDEQKQTTTTETVATATQKVEKQAAPEIKAEAPKAETAVVEEKVQEETPKVDAPKEETVVAETQKVVEEVKETVTKEVKEAVAETSIDGGQLFAKCAACHGQNGEKPALGKSKVIKGWSEEKVLNALHGYKDGTYGGAMKGVMKSQVGSYSEDELKVLAKHISKL